MRFCGPFFLNVLDLGTWGHSVSIVLGSHRGQQHGLTPRKLRCLALPRFFFVGGVIQCALPGEVFAGWKKWRSSKFVFCAGLCAFLLARHISRQRCSSRGAATQKTTTIAKHFLFGMGTIMYVMFTFTPIWHSVWHKSVSCVSRPCGFTCGLRPFCSNRRSGHAIKKAKQFLAKILFIV